MKRLLFLVPCGAYFLAAALWFLSLCVMLRSYLLHFDSVYAVLLKEDPLSFFLPPLFLLFAFVFFLCMGVKVYRANRAKK